MQGILKWMAFAVFCFAGGPVAIAEAPERDVLLAQRDPLSGLPGGDSLAAEFSPSESTASKKPEITVETLTATDAVHPGSMALAAVRAALTKGWHVNAHEPLEDFLIPTDLTLEEIPGISVDAYLYPEPLKIELGAVGGLMAVYEEQFTIGIRLLVGEGVAPGEYTLTGELQYQACNDKQCWAPQAAPVSLTLKVVESAAPLTEQHQDVFEGLVGNAAAAAPDGGADRTASAAGSGDWRALIDDFTVAGTGGFMNAEQFLAFLDGAEGGQAAAPSGAFAGKSMLAIIALILVGGLGLNLTPCVLPIIPINLGIIGAGARASSRMRGFSLGGVYGLGIALVYGALGLIVILTTGSFGAINASPWFNFAIVILFILLGLAMFDVIAIDFSRFQAKLGIKKKEGGSFLVAFFMGAVSALLAGACVAPVVIAVIVYARDLYAAGHTAALALPFLLGVGMALPWPVAGAGLSALPKPGKWMVYVKYAFGVFIFLLAAYYGKLGYSLFVEQYLLDEEAVAASAQEYAGKGWETSLAAGLAKAKAENKPVLIDFWATWCKNCIVMNQTTLKDAAVTARLRGFVPVKYQAQQPDQPPHKELFDRFPDFVGLPFFVILEPKG